MLEALQKKKWGKKMSENYVHEGGGGEGLTPSGKIHLKFPF